jgi:hypothetical protein
MGSVNLFAQERSLLMRERAKGMYQVSPLRVLEFRVFRVKGFRVLGFRVKFLGFTKIGFGV